METWRHGDSKPWGHGGDVYYWLFARTAPHRTTLHVNVQGVGNKYYVITDAILKDDLGVGKVGHRATILAACVPQLD